MCFSLCYCLLCACAHLYIDQAWTEVESVKVYRNKCRFLLLTQEFVFMSSSEQVDKKELQHWRPTFVLEFTFLEVKETFCPDFV